ncbi:exported protein of unknown function [Streptantibioticus cattleyicolor NRRL 8057 = DSM 46488]|nr:exported protein of unknown function [Streptantibioticus cattleyicolor NRRL 8057 = DSM 46488]
MFPSSLVPMNGLTRSVSRPCDAGAAACATGSGPAMKKAAANAATTGAPRREAGNPGRRAVRRGKVPVAPGAPGTGLFRRKMALRSVNGSCPFVLTTLSVPVVTDAAPWSGRGSSTPPGPLSRPLTAPSARRAAARHHRHAKITRTA